VKGNRKIEVPSKPVDFTNPDPETVIPMQETKQF